MTEELYTWKEFDKDCQQIVKWIKEKKLKFRNVYGIPRGGLILAVRLSHLLDIPLAIHRTSIHSTTLIVDDISDTGKTLKELFESNNNFKNNKVATIFYKKDSVFKPDYYLRIKKDKWIHYPWEK